MGYSYTTDFSEESIDILINEALDNAKVLENESKEFIFQGSLSYKEVNNYNPDFNKVTAKEKIDFTLELEKYAKSLDSRITAVNNCIFGDGYGKRVIKNSKGLNLTSEGNSAHVYISVIVKDGEETKSGDAFIISRDFKEFDYEKVAKEAVEMAVSKLKGKEISSGNYNVIFKNSITSSLLASFMNIFSAEAVDKGLSKLKGKIGEEIFGKNITLAEDPFSTEGLSSRAFDDEGVATSFKEIVKNGTLTTYFHNLRTANKFGVEPTGNATKGSFAGVISISPSNFYLQKGETSFEELVGKCEDGVYITDLAGLHSGISSLSGDFSLFAEGFKIENGKIAYPIKQMTVAGNFFDMLNDVKELGSNFEFAINGVGAPAILVNKLSISS